MIAIRGAISVDSNTTEDIKKASIELMDQIIELNNLNQEDIVSIIFSCTEDITKDYPGRFIREHFNLTKTAIMHFNEMKVDNSLPMCIRILVLVNRFSEKDPVYVYLKEAKSLRKDLQK